MKTFKYNFDLYQLGKKMMKEGGLLMTCGQFSISKRKDLYVRNINNILLSGGVTIKW